jgi:hypothetical protein
MQAYSLDELKSAHKHSSFHETEILASEKCGCFYCFRTFDPSEIEEWGYPCNGLINSETFLAL